MRLLKYIGDFFLAVYKGWVSLMSGIASVILGALVIFWGNKYELLRDNKTTFKWVAIACLALAVISVWIRKCKELDAERDKNAKPKIKVEIEEVYTEFTVNDTGKYPNYADWYFTLKVYVANSGTPASIREYAFDVITDKGTLPTVKTPLDHLLIQREQRQTPKWGIHYSKSETIQDSLCDVSVINLPLQEGEQRAGWLRFVLLDTTGIGLEEIKAIILHVIAHEGTRRSVTLNRTEWKRSGELVNKYLQEFEWEMEKSRAEEKAKRKANYDSISEFVRQRREIEKNRITNLSLYERQKGLWGGRVFEFLRDLGDEYASRFQNPNPENDTAALEEIQKNFLLTD
jgi:hypothetical protein